MALPLLGAAILSSCTGAADASFSSSTTKSLVEGNLSPVAQEILKSENVASASQLKDPAHRAQFSFEGLKTNQGGTGSLQEKQTGDKATAWTYGQAMVAALDQGKITGNYQDFQVLASNLAKYREPGGGYGPVTNGRTGKGDRYYDDNAWIGLAYVQAYTQTKNPEYLKEAKDVFTFLKSGMQPDGGLVWVEHAKNPTYNTCVEGPAAELALRLHLASPNEGYLQYGERLYAHMHKHLEITSGPKAGLYSDNVSTDLAKRSDDIWSYNEGTPVGAATLLYRISGEQKYLEQARQTADASLNYYGKGDALWKQPPAFNAIYLRNLLQLDGVAPSPAIESTLREYNSRVWTQVLNPASGLFDKPTTVPIGRYGDDSIHVSTLDQSALVQLQALQSFPRSFYPDVT